MEVGHSPGFRMGHPGRNGWGIVTRDGCPLILSPLQCQINTFSVVKDEGECANDGLGGGVFRCMSGSGV